MTRALDFEKNGKFKNNHCSPRPNSARCDLNTKGDVLKINDMCLNAKCNCQKLITFTPKQIQLERQGLKTFTKTI